VNTAFADSFYWIAMLDPRDPHHEWAINLSLPPRLVTSRPVLIEVMDALCGLRTRTLVSRFWHDCRKLERLEIAPVDERLVERAAELFSLRLDKTWSLTDCISFTIMSDFAISLALTGDHHFTQAGFQIAFP
jgi:predicted nucleic acid-binding protein